MSKSPRRTATPRQGGAQQSATKAGEGYCPDAGDFIWIDLNPTQGHEQQGRRPAIVISPRSYNDGAGLCVACPITNRAQGYPFEVPIPDGHGVTGVVLADHLRNLPWAPRRAEFIAAAPPDVLSEARAKIAALIEID